MTTSEDMTLIGIERRMAQLINQLAIAQHELADCRNAEVYAKHDYESRQRRLVWSPNAPQVGRGEGKVTAAQREAWVAMNCETEQRVYDIAVTRREAAADHLRTLRDQSMLVTALAKSIAVSMGLAGRSD
jgi:hypothetical protein